ncbi:hypothetical protein [Anabaena catenula]|uniref:Uncharacterized protein n=1 Tax=Anabaena catenula FACHB-362 TaxID=2692877 RepID=A0ABR8J3V9_9NOST|nr:hypothetical protein [Anabaena catenula]MBD2692134.1 hypothetical protein [Anabaena catenula FACHB-362]
MDKSQSVKQQSSQTTETSLEIVKETSQPKNLLVKYPWILFVGLLGIPLGVATFSYYELSYVGDVPHKQPEKPPNLVVKQPITITSDTSNATPAWLILAIALTCASGCLVIFRLLKLPQRI